MQPLWHSFAVLQFIGVWRPVHWSPGSWKTRVYDSYTWFMVILVIIVVISELIELATSIDNVEEFANNSFMLLTLISDCGKAANILTRRNEIIELTRVLKEEPCRPKSEEELTIQRKFDDLIRSFTLRYGALVGLTVFSFVLRSIVEDIPRKALLYNSWLPFDYHESSWSYSIIYSQQIIHLLACAAVGATFDTLVPGLMLQTCAQLNILQCRFRRMPKTLMDHYANTCSGEELDLLANNLETKLLGQCVNHHILIFKFSKTLNDIFGIMIFIQYTISTMVLCVSVLQLSKMKLFEPEFTALFIYLICMGVQIFLYCFYGCKVTLESIAIGDSVYDIDWASLSIKTKRSLLMIMIRALRPIQFTSGYVITLNLDYFNSLLKFSYSAYNVLQKSYVQKE